MGKIVAISILLAVLLGVGLNHYATPGNQNLLGSVRLTSTAQAQESDKKVAMNDWSIFGNNPEEAVKQDVVAQQTKAVETPATKPAPVATTLPATGAPNGAIKASKDVADKIVAAAPLVLEALKECPEAPIPPAMITGMWGKEDYYCEGLPAELCPVSSAKAVGPMQHVKQKNGFAYIKAGEDPEKLGDALKMTVRHLCFARRYDNNGKIDPASDVALMRYHGEKSYANPSKYVESVRSKQQAHEQIWAAIMSGKAPTFATTEAVEKLLLAGYVRTTRGNFFNPNGAPVDKSRLFPTVPLTRKATWVSAWGDRRNHGGTIVPHGGFDAGCHTTGEPLVSACEGTVVTAATGSDGLAGKMVAVMCGDEKITLEHMDRIDVVVGQKVAVDEQIGTCGHTGNAEPKPGEAPAPHAHIQLAVRNGKGWRNVNPCEAAPGITALECFPKMASEGTTRLNPIRDVVVTK
jgi:murein DD-endopeptidase MepM/ murein hydrolase activator NlpD